jgi:hypothetical protein
MLKEQRAMSPSTPQASVRVTATRSRPETGAGCGAPAATAVKVHVLGPGLDGQVLTTKGGTADPQWGGGSGATGGGVDKVFVQNDQAVTTDYTIPATQNAMSTGPITINTGITVTVSTGAVWVIL